MPELPGGPSEAAIRRAEGDFARTGGHLPEAVAAAHDPALGLDRSVRLGDVVEWLQGAKAWPGDGTHDFAPDEWADAVAREFGGGSDAG